MTSEQLQEYLGIPKMPPYFYEIYETVKETTGTYGQMILSDAYIQSTLDSVGVLFNYRDIILKAAAELREQPRLVLLVCLLERWVKHGMSIDFSQYEAPKETGLAYDFLHLFPAIPTMPETARDMRERGVPEDIILASLREYDYCVSHREYSRGRPLFDYGRLDWMLRVIDKKLIRIGRLKYDLPKPKITDIRVFRNTKGELTLLADNMEVHRCGRILGAEGIEDPEGSFLATITETDDCWTGHPIIDGNVKRETVRLEKSSWELCLSPEDPLISVHIPPFEPFEPNLMEESYQRARQILTECYPDYPFKGFWCRSWLMSLDLKKILKPGSNILAFQEPYIRYPFKSPGLGVFYNTFPKHGKPADLHSLPEDTSLQRGVKETYLNGGYIHDFCGFFF